MAFELLTLESKTKMRSNVVEAVSRLDVSKDKIIVVGGAALQVFGIKKSEDIYLVTSPELFSEILDGIEYYNSERNLGKLKLGHIGIMATAVGKDRGQRIYDDGYGVTLGQITYMPAPTDHLYQTSFEELQGEAVDIDGILVSPPERILAWKEGVARPKDLEDIDLIQRFMAKQYEVA